MIGSHQSAASETVDWLTPPDWIAALGPFDLDPCASVNQPWRTARIEWTSGGLGPGSWDRGLVWLNPPYGPPAVINPWVERLAAHNNGIACIFARTETRLWHESIWPLARTVLFVRGRPHFHKPVTGERAKGNSGAPVALIAYGAVASMRLKRSRIPGALITPIGSTTSGGSEHGD